MRTVLFVDYYEWYGGGQHSLLSILKGLDRTHYRPLLAVNVEGRLANETRKLGVPVLVADTGRGRWRYFWRAIPAYLSMLNFALEHGVDLVHSNGLKAAKFGSAVAKTLCVPSIWHKRIHVDKSPRSSTARLWRFYSRFQDLMIGVSAAVVDGLEQLGIKRNRLVSLPNFVDPTPFERAKPLTAKQRKAAGIPSGVPLVGMVAARRHHKGPDLFLEAMARMAKQGGIWKRAHFVMIGATVTGEESFDAYVRQMEKAFLGRYPRRLHVLGEKDNIASWLKSMTLFVCPSRREGFGRVTVEAMAAGCPVVAAYPEAVEIIQHGKTGWLAPPGDVGGLTAALQAALRSPRKTRQVAASGSREAMLRFGPEAYFRRLSELYQSVLRHA